ncbi:MAG: hypothetical protein M3Y60_04165 [Bacteroidota bacterium]|nr:hypothetical protein [Bacteroidota bacterium]
MISVAFVAIATIVEMDWQSSATVISASGFLLLHFCLAVTFTGSIILNMRLIKGTGFKFFVPPRVGPQWTLLIASVLLLYLLGEGLRIVVYFDEHLSQYYLMFIFPQTIKSLAGGWLDDVSIIDADGRQVAVLLFCILAVNVAISLYNTGLFKAKLPLRKSALTRPLVTAQIVTGILLCIAGLLGFISFCFNVQAFLDYLQFDPAVLNFSNITALLYPLIRAFAIILYGQWILRDGWKLRQVLIKGQLEFT